MTSPNAPDPLARQRANGSARRGLWFAGSALVSAAAMIAVGWGTGLRETLHGSLIFLAVSALLPLLIAASVAALVLAVGVLLAITSAVSGDTADVAGVERDLVASAGEGLVAWFRRGVRGYYGFLHRHRHAPLWGVPAGMVLGALAIWALLAWLVIPREAATLAILLHAKAAIEGEYERSGRYPEPAGGRYLASSTASPSAGDEVVRDAFGRNVLYETRGRWKARSFTLVSLGFDGRESGDDLCVSGETRLQRWLDRAASPLAWLLALERGETTWGQRLEMIGAMRCSQVEAGDGR
jgi:hypothetical protein